METKTLNTLSKKYSVEKVGEIADLISVVKKLNHNIMEKEIEEVQETTYQISTILNVIEEKTKIFFDLDNEIYDLKKQIKELHEIKNN